MTIPELELGGLVAALTALTAAVGFMGRRFLKWLKPHIVNLQSVQNISELEKKVDRILYEIGENHGKSLKDTVVRIERRLTFFDHRHWATLQDVEHAVIETDANGYVTRVNRTYLRWTGRAAEELVREGWKNAIHPEDLQRVATEWEHAVNDKRNIDLSFRMIDLQGKPSPVRAQCYRISTGTNQEGAGYFVNIYRLQH